MDNKFPQHFVTLLLCYLLVYFDLLPFTFHLDLKRTFPPETGTFAVMASGVKRGELTERRASVIMREIADPQGFSVISAKEIEAAKKAGRKRLENTRHIHNADKRGEKISSLKFCWLLSKVIYAYTGPLIILLCYEGILKLQDFVIGNWVDYPLLIALKLEAFLNLTPTASVVVATIIQYLFPVLFGIGGFIHYFCFITKRRSVTKEMKNS